MVELTVVVADVAADKQGLFTSLQRFLGWRGEYQGAAVRTISILNSLGQ